MSNKADNAAAWAEAVAWDDAHGYDQANRWGQPDMDCSALAILAYENAGVPVETNGATYTGNMRPVFLRCGFRDVTGEVSLPTGAGLLRGDVLLNERAHTAIYAGGGRIIHARGNEFGGVTGGLSGDQTGREVCTQAYFNFPWDCVLRYEEEEGTSSAPGGAPSPPGEGYYTVQPGDTLWGIAEKVYGQGWDYTKLIRINKIQKYFIYPGQVLRLTEEENGPPGAAAPTDAAGTYTVKAGDCLWSIAADKLGAGERYTDIVKLNGLSDFKIYPGQVLQIPER